MTDTELAEMTSAELTQIIRQQEATIARLEAEVAELEAQVARLKSQLEEAQRAGKRQATPFSKEEPKAHPRQPGQKKGHPAAHRALPDHVDRVEEAPLPERCPRCGGQMIEDEVQIQYQVDIPRPIPILVTQFNVHVGHCEACHKRVQGRHAEQTSDALGAAAVQIGPQAIGLACEMKHGLGVSYGKVAHFFRRGFGLGLQRSTVCRADLRLARKVEPTYDRLILRLRQSEVVYADETGWKVAGGKAWLWVFTNDEVSVYVIDPTRAHEVVERILGEDFRGILKCDCFLAYDALDYQQSKCVGHLLRRCAELMEGKSGQAVCFSQQVAKILRAAITLKERRTTMSPHGYAVACGRLEAAMNRLLASQDTDPDNARLAKLLRKHRQQLFTFLYVEAVAPTNNDAEREIRPAVIIRKTNGCNRSDAGATTHSILSSVIRTCQKHNHDFVNVAKQVMRSPEAIAVDVASDTDDALEVQPIPTFPQEAQGP